MQRCTTWTALTVSLVLSHSSAAAQSVYFDGKTTADRVLIRDVMRDIVGISKKKLHCPTITLVEPSVLPKPSRSSAMVDPADGRDATYEQWIVTLCGSKELFLVVFWPAAIGGTNYRISHPFHKKSRA